MTHDEAKEFLIQFKEDNNWGGSIPEVLDIAIKAIEENQAFQKIGRTPAQIYSKIGAYNVELSKFMEIGTSEEFRMLKEKANTFQYDEEVESTLQNLKKYQKVLQAKAKVNASVNPDMALNMITDAIKTIESTCFHQEENYLEER